METDCPECGGAVAVGRRGAPARCERCGADFDPDRRRPADDRAAPDRPRRRRRPPPDEPDPGARRRLLVVLVATGLFVFVGCSGILGFAVWAAQPAWQTFNSAPGGYAVELPAAPRRDMREIAANHGPVQPGVEFEGTILLGRLEEYSIVFADIPADVRATNTDAQLLDQMTADIKDGDPPVTVKASRAVTVSGFPGRELDLDLGGQHRLARVVVARTRLYTVVAGGPFTAADEPRVRRFIDSFKITDPRLLNAPKAGPPAFPVNPWKLP